MDWRGVEQGFDAGQDGREHDASGGDIEASGTVAQQAAPVCEPAEAALHHPAAFKDHKTLLLGVALDHTVAHAVPVRPFLAALGNKGTVEDGFTQARPFCFACIQGRKRVAFLGGGRDHGDGEPGAVGIDQGNALAPQHLLGGVIPARATDRDALIACQ